MKRRLISGLLLGSFVGVGSSCGSNNSSSDDADSGTATTSQSQGSTQTQGSAQSASATTGNSATSSSNATASAAATGAGGSDANSNDASTTSVSSTTGVGGSAGDATTATNTTAAGAGGSGGDSGDACPNEPPLNGGPCSGPGAICAYEDCAGAGRSVAVCTQGTWFVETSACSDMVYCSGGSEICSAGEVCLIMAGGAFLQSCVPNTCEGEAVECDCTQGCYGECATFGSAETGITITCNTCPDGMCP